MVKTAESMAIEVVRLLLYASQHEEVTKVTVTVTTEVATFAPGKTRNPHHLGHTPGGSSSGRA